MTFGPFPSQLLLAIQQNYLERAFIDSLLPVLVYRSVADQETFPGRIGDTITKTRVGLMIPNTTPVNPSTNTNFDNGLTPQNYSAEQYTLAVQQYAQLANDINLIDDETTIAAFAIKNAENLGIACAQALDILARNALFNAYMGGNTVVTQTLGSAGPTIHIDDTRGFQTVSVNGSVVAISSGNPLPVYVNGTLYQITAFTNDSTNVSSAAITGGTSGTITSSTNITVLNGTAGNAVIGQYAPLIVRPNGRTTTASIQATDLLTMTVILQAVTQLRSNAVPKIDGHYNLYMTPDSMSQLYQDPEFQVLNRGVSTRDPVYENAWVYDAFLDVRFIQTTQAFVQPPQPSAPVPVAQTIQRPILCGKGALVEGIFNVALSAIKNMSPLISNIGPTDNFVNVLGEMSSNLGFYMTLRPPIDRLSQIISQAANYIGGFTVPTDVTTNPNTIATASNAYYKRAVVIETAS